MFLLVDEWYRSEVRLLFFQISIMNLLNPREPTRKPATRKTRPRANRRRKASLNGSVHTNRGLSWVELSDPNPPVVHLLVLQYTTRQSSLFIAKASNQSQSLDLLYRVLFVWTIYNPPLSVWNNHVTAQSSLSLSFSSKYPQFFQTSPTTLVPSFLSSGNWVFILHFCFLWCIR